MAIYWTSNHPWIVWGDEETIPKWLLEHAVLWWPDLLPKSSKLQDFLQKVQLNYCASCSPSDLLARRLLINTAQHFSQRSSLEVWSFRSWAQLLKPWTSSSWENLDQRRVRATTEDFAFDTQKRTLAEDGGVQRRLRCLVIVNAEEDTWNCKNGI